MKAVGGRLGSLMKRLSSAPHLVGTTGGRKLGGLIIFRNLSAVDEIKHQNLPISIFIASDGRGNDFQSPVFRRKLECFIFQKLRSRIFKAGSDHIISNKIK